MDLLTYFTSLALHQHFLPTKYVKLVCATFFSSKKVKTPPSQCKFPTVSPPLSMRDVFCIGRPITRGYSSDACWCPYFKSAGASDCVPFAMWVLYAPVDLLRPLFYPSAAMQNTFRTISKWFRPPNYGCCFHWVKPLVDGCCDTYRHRSTPPPALPTP